VQRVTDTEYFLERARHRPPAGPAGEHKRTVDVEEDESDRTTAYLSLRFARCQRADLWLTALPRT
jgi:hypothetical protein